MTKRNGGSGDENGAKLHNCHACVCKSNVEIGTAGSSCRPQGVRREFSLHPIFAGNLASRDLYKRRTRVENPAVGGGGDSHMKGAGKLVGNFE